MQQTPNRKSHSIIWFVAFIRTISNLFRANRVKYWMSWVLVNEWNLLGRKRERRWRVGVGIWRISVATLRRVMFRLGPAVYWNIDWESDSMLGCYHVLCYLATRKGPMSTERFAKTHHLAPSRHMWRFYTTKLARDRIHRSRSIITFLRTFGPLHWE